MKDFLKRKMISVALGALRRYSALETVQGPLTYNQDGLATRHNCDFMHDPRFIEAYTHGKNTGSWGGPEVDIHFRAYVACWVANRARYLEGDFVECGVNKGGQALAVMHYVEFMKLNKRYYLLDTFEGLSENYLTEAEKKLGINRWGYHECYEEVKQTFRTFPNVEIIRGTVPETLSQVQTDRIAYLLIDMNCAAPEIAAAEYFWPKLTSGAIMLLDDYAYITFDEQKQAFNAFAARKDVQVLTLPTGQGIIIKP